MSVRDSSISDDPARSAPSVAHIIARIDRLPGWGLSYGVFVIVGLAYFFAFYDISAISFTLPVLAAQYDFTGIDIAYPVAFNLLGYAIGAYILGTLADRLGRRPAMLITVIVLGAGGLLTAFSWGLWSLTVFRFITGLGMGAEISLAAAMIVELSSSRQRARNMQITYLFGAAGLTVTPFVAILLLDIGPIGWRMVFGLGAVVAVMLVFMRDRWLPESPRWLVVHGQLEKAEALVASMERRVVTRSGQKLPPLSSSVPAERAYSRNSIAELFRPPYLRRTLVVLGFWLFWYVTVYGYLGYLPTILIEMGLTRPEGLIYAALGQSATIIGGIVAFLLVNLSQRKFLIGGFTAVFIIGLLLIVTNASGFWLFLGTFFGSMMIAANSIGYLYTVEVFPTRMRATAMALGDGVGHLGGVAAPFIVVGALAGVGASGTLWLLIVFLVVAGVIMVAGGVRTSGRSLTDIAD